MAPTLRVLRVMACTLIFVSTIVIWHPKYFVDKWVPFQAFQDSNVASRHGTGHPEMTSSDRRLSFISTMRKTCILITCTFCCQIIIEIVIARINLRYIYSGHILFFKICIVVNHFIFSLGECVRRVVIKLF